MQPVDAVIETDFEARVSRYATNELPANYEFDSTLSLDENYMVLTLIYARLSMSKRGNMACIIVRDTTSPADDPSEPPPPPKRARTSPPTRSGDSTRFDYSSYPGCILSHSNNYPQPHTVAVEIPQRASTSGKQAAKPKPGQTHFLIKASQFPELHAEARAICISAAQGVALGGATAYVSFPPCAACLPLLVASGIRRLVYRQTLGTIASVELCQKAGVECIEIVDKEVDERLKDKANHFWKDQREGKDETRARLERWWAAQERDVMGDLYEAAKGATAKSELAK